MVSAYAIATLGEKSSIATKGAKDKSSEAAVTTLFTEGKGKKILDELRRRAVGSESSEGDWSVD